jgi:ABC-type Fe3+-siderophore transport system permease subunit|tara:strand:- start:57 stop:197 length:141 start_codon:yes stop_codon:yes gene_type:complete
LVRFFIGKVNFIGLIVPITLKIIIHEQHDKAADTRIIQLTVSDAKL